MKKFFLKLSVVVIATSLMAFSCEKDNNDIPFGNLPSVAQSFVNQYFPNVKVIKTEKGTNGTEIDLANGIEVDFDQNGNWVKVDARDGQALPNITFIPQSIRDYVSKTYPKNAINGIEKKVNGYEVELVGLKDDLYFNLNGNVSDGPSVTPPSTSVPTNVTAFLNEFFPNIKIIKTEKGTKGTEIDLENGIEVDFDQNGNWVKVDARDGQALSNITFIPQSIRDYIAKNHTKNAINSIEKKVNGYEVELVGLKNDLYFNVDGVIIGTPNVDTPPTVPTPNVGTAFLKEFFPNVKIIKTEKGTNGTEIDLENGVEIDFDQNGNWVKVDARDGQALPNITFIPQSIRDYVNKTYPKNAINGIEKKVNGYEVELVNVNKDLVFDLNGIFIKLQ